MEWCIQTFTGSVFTVHLIILLAIPGLVYDMGYAMSRLEMDTEGYDNTSVSEKKSNCILDHEIIHLTNLKLRPDENLIRNVPGKRCLLPISPVKMLEGRECNYSGKGRFSSADCCHVLSRYLPVNGPYLVDQMTSRAYVSQFSADGSLFVAGFQGSTIRIYNVDRGWKVHKNIIAKSLRWTITDASLSPDQRYLVYSSITPIVHIVNIGSSATQSSANITETHEGLDFSIHGNPRYVGIFSVKFSKDGQEIVAGSNDDSIYVYDLEANKLSLRISAHTCDVNTVCYADETGHLLFSGSDDTHCKVWDKRCISTRESPVGVLTGHVEGITSIDSRGDGRHFISNGKDQALKLWDIRTMSSSIPCSARVRHQTWDYRWVEYPTEASHMKHPNDMSVTTYTGHSVLRTLIRCYFSPTHSTGQKYIYTGSNDSRVYIYDVVSGGEVGVLKHHRLPVRDCSWHPEYPMLVTSSWDGKIVKWEMDGKELEQG